MIRFDLKPRTTRSDTPQWDYVELRPWQPGDRQVVAAVIAEVLAEYGLGWEADGADRDVVEVEACYVDRGGEFWVIEAAGTIVGTGAFYPIDRHLDRETNHTVNHDLDRNADRNADRNINGCEIRKMYLKPEIRGRGVGRFLLQWLEQRAVMGGFGEAWIETASVLAEAVQLYESAGYEPSTGVETARCDRVYRKRLSPSEVLSD
jgi:putative acetyltransferase